MQFVAYFLELTTCVSHNRKCAEHRAPLVSDGGHFINCHALVREETNDRRKKILSLKTDSIGPKNQNS